MLEVSVDQTAQQVSSSAHQPVSMVEHVSKSLDPALAVPALKGMLELGVK